MRIQRVVLEDQTDAAVLRGQFSYIVVAEEDFSAGGLLQTADHVQRRALAAAGWTEQSDQLAIRDFKVEITYGDDFLVRFLVAAGKNLCQVLQDDFHTLPFLSLKISVCLMGYCFSVRFFFERDHFLAGIEYHLAGIIDDDGIRQQIMD